MAQQLHSISGSIVVFDRKRKQDMAQKLQQKWQRWEISNFDYLMQVGSSREWPQLKGSVTVKEEKNNQM